MKPELYKIISLLLGSFALTYTLVPYIINVSVYKRLMDSPNGRSSHKTATPSLGGIAFYISIILSFYFLDSWDRYNSIPSMLPGLTILFIIGLKDDLVVLSARTKLLSQIGACLFVLFHYKFEIYTLNGFMGITFLNKYFAAVLALFLMLAILNSFNLIDGIDGLASLIGVTSFICFGTIFFQTKTFLLFGLCLVLIGSLAAFLRYNMSHKKKIFMGDTGSMIIGFMAAVMAIRMLSLPPDALAHLPFKAANTPFVVASFLIIPLYDMSRVVIIRLLNKKGPFSPDRNHTHHLLIDQFQISHKKASLFLGIFNILFAGLFVYLSQEFSGRWVLLFFLASLVIISIFLYLVKLGKIGSDKLAITHKLVKEK